MPSVTSELLNLEVNFLEASTTNNIESLAKFDQDLRSFATRANEACSNGSLSKDEAKIHLVSAHNIQLFASSVAKAQLAMDTLCQDFFKNLKFSLPSVAPSVSTSPSPAAPSIAAPPEDSAPKDDASSAVSQSLLKTWSQEHLSSLYPTKKQRTELASLASMSDKQVMLWFRNARARSGWTKLYGHVQKDQARLKILLDEYHSLRRLHRDEELQKIIAREEAYQLVEKVLRWFDTSKKSTKSAPAKSIRPWVKDVLFSTMDTLKRGGSNSHDNLNQPAFPSGWDSSPESTPLSSTGPVASTSSVGSSSRSSSPQPSSSRSSNSSVRSTSPASTNTSLSSSSAQSQASSSCSTCITGQTSSFPPLPGQLFDYSSPEPFSSPICIPTNDSSSPVVSIVSGDLPASPSQPPNLLAGLASLQSGTSEIEAGQFDDALED